MQQPAKKSSSNWYTPAWLWALVYKTLGTHNVFDPCPGVQNPTFDGLALDWSVYKATYVNPPIPAQDWASKAIDTIQKADTAIVFIAFSPNVIFQDPRLLSYPICWVRKRISYIDGRLLLPSGEMNPRYLMPHSNSSQYSAIILIVRPNRYLVKLDFNEAFKHLGRITPGY